MKIKTILILCFALIKSAQVSAQWKYQVIDNGIDDKFKVAYTDKPGQKQFLILSPYADSTAAMSVYLGYVCTENPSVDVSFKMDTGWSKYHLTGITSEDKKKVYVCINVDYEFGAEFRKCSMLRIRVNDAHCGTEIYDFNMSGSSAALKFVTGK